MTDEQLNKQAGVYRKLRPFIRRVGNRLIWDPSTSVAMAPTFEQFLEITRLETVPAPVGPTFCRCTTCLAVGGAV